MVGQRAGCHGLVCNATSVDLPQGIVVVFVFFFTAFLFRFLLPPATFFRWLLYFSRGASPLCERSTLRFVTNGAFEAILSKR
jgi:hypothetical protein